MKTVLFAVCASTAVLLAAMPVAAADGGVLPDTIDDVAGLDGGPGTPLAPVPRKKPGSLPPVRDSGDRLAADRAAADEDRRIVERELPAPYEETLRRPSADDGTRRARLEADLRRRAEAQEALRRRRAPDGRVADVTPGYAADEPPAYDPGRRRSPRFAGYDLRAPYDAWDEGGGPRRWRIVRRLRERGFREPHGFRCNPVHCRLFAFRHGHLYRLVIDPRHATVLRQRALDWY